MTSGLSYDRYTGPEYVNCVVEDAMAADVFGKQL